MLINMSFAAYLEENFLGLKVKDEAITIRSEMRVAEELNADKL